jgi:hypothetical protein
VWTPAAPDAVAPQPATTGDTGALEAFIASL